MNREFAEDIVKKALKRGCDVAEVFAKNSKGISVEAKDGEVEALKASQDRGLSLKVIRKQRVGFAFATSPEEIDRMIEGALKGAEYAGIDEYADVPERMPPAEVLIFDEKIKRLREDDVIRDALLLEERALAFDGRIKKVRKAQAGGGVGQTVIVNSRGVNISYESTYYSASVTALAQEGGESQMGWDYAGSRKMGDIDLSHVGSAAAARAIELLGSRKISAAKVPVILSPSVAVDFLEILSASLSAEAVQKGRSFLAGKLGQTVMSTLVDIVDDGVMPWGTGTRPVDDEGVSASSKAVVSKGVLTGYFHNTYTARKAGVKSTGNAVRGSFKSLPGIDVTNFHIKAEGNNPSKSPLTREGLQDSNQLIKSMSKGILIFGAMGVHTANPVSGDFSVGISGLWIENGAAVYPFKEAVISGNILEMFKKIEGIGDDLKFYGSTGSPSLLIGDMDVSA